ncbi:LuxR C-terminal-related transcriptional regulator [Catellatospora sp. NPDC049133]|uniref:helix-turn-helix transcriptional regulator n=1 Tax=Catellatospora sp. NPDC049133 TaxID=3155499 RepID=UPI0033FA063A
MVPLTPLHGRDSALLSLTSMLDAARAGHGGALLVRGEPGLGKTALLRYAMSEAGGFQVLPGCGVEPESDLPYAGLHRLLRPVARRLPELPELSARQAEVLRRVLDGEADEPGDRAVLLPAALLALLAVLARDAPVLVCVDDVDLLDAPSREALAFAARRLGGIGASRPAAGGLASVADAVSSGGGTAGGPGAGRDSARDEGEAVVILLSCGDDEALPPPGLPVLTLSALDDAACAEVVGQVAPVAVAEGVRLRLAAAAAGNPQAVTELVAALAPDQLGGVRPLPDPLPPCTRLQHAHLRQVRALPEQTRRLLLIAAAEDEMDTNLLVRAADEAGLDLAALEPAESAGLVRVGPAGVEFRHPQLRAAIYQTAPLARRRAAHALLARLLDESRHPLRRAWHRAAAGLAPDHELAEELESAAASARHRGGYATASAAYERAAELSTGDDGAKARRLAAAARDAWHAGRSARARDLLDRALPAAPGAAARGELELLRGDIDLRDGRASDAYEALLTAAHRLAPIDPELAVRAMMRAGEAGVYAGDHRRFLQVAAQAAPLRGAAVSPQATVMLDYLEALSAIFLGRFGAALAPLRAVLDGAPRIDDPSALIWASIAALILGDNAQGRVMAARAVALARGRGALTMVPKALEFSAYAEFWTGRHAAATANALEGLRAATETGQGNGACHHLAALALLDAIHGDEQTCRLRARTALDRAGLYGLGLPAALSTWALAFLDLSLGRHADAAGRLRGLARAGPGQGHMAVAALSVPTYVEAAVRTGASDAARAAFTTFEPWADSTSSPDNLALAARCRALLSEGGEAEEHFRAALQLHAVGDRAFERARTELLYGALLRRRRKRAEARAELRSALESFERLHADRWAEWTRAELRATGESARPRLTEPDGELTPQQRQIARLAAQGATNREIAAQLFLSPRTVEHHLGNIFTRLGVRSRVELANLLP